MICVALLCAAARIAAAQSTVPPTDPGQKTVQVVRTATAPVIDGDLSDAVWSTAAVVDDLHQVSPIEYAEPYERTEVLILYGDEALYIAARLYDTEPELITAKNMRQNDQIGQDDRLYVTIDPFNDRRSGYYFGVNPNGVRSDGLYRNVTEFYGDWDSIRGASINAYSAPALRRRPANRVCAPCASGCARQSPTCPTSTRSTSTRKNSRRTGKRRCGLCTLFRSRARSRRCRPWAGRT